MSLYDELTQTEFDELVSKVVEALQQQSTGVNEYPVATTLSGVMSMPAYRGTGNDRQVVTVLTELLKGDPVELRNTGTEWQWKLTSDTQWKTLVTMAQLQQPAIAAATAVTAAMSEISIEWDTVLKPAMIQQMEEIDEEWTGTLKPELEAAIASAEETADHPNYVGDDFYVYRWNKDTKNYDKTDTYLKGEGFHIEKTYTSVEAMNADVNNPEIREGDFVLINTGSVEEEDTAKLYVKSKQNGVFVYVFVVDMSGARGFTGHTPQISIGTITKTVPGGTPSASLSPDGTAENGDPKFKLNLVLPTGDTGPVPVIEIGTVATGAVGSEVQASLVENGTTAEGVRKYKLNLTIPRGDKGEDGTGTGNLLADTASVMQGRKYLFVPDANGSASGTLFLFTGLQDYAVTTGTGSAYVASVVDFPSVLAAGAKVVVKTHVANLATCTLKVNDTAAKTVTRFDGSPLEATDIALNGLHYFLYDGTNWILLNPTRCSNSAKLESKSLSGVMTDVDSKIATHNAETNAHPDIRNHVDQVEAIARGKSRARVFDTVADLDSWLAVPANVAQLQVGDNFYIVQTDVPDYWWDGTQKQPLETEKVVLPTPLPKTAVLSVVGWVASHNTAMGEYQYTVTDTDITDGADIDISIADAASSDIAVAANLYNGISAAVGQFIIYCKTIPTGNININYRISWL